ncbi:energy-coupling factor ABC transporter ATP-binding protein [Aeribacillus pallidus]|uniref:energy-coupling factor ABC transporter ATP-binding protein n=1 Tax=Aeribacillus pallidus TaxID=33936 RepID=UPI003D207882
MEKLISVKNVYFQYPGQEGYALENVTFDVFAGEWVALVGHNGSGKSTLAKMLNGLHFPQKGSVEVCGYELNEQNIWEIRKHIGMVFQNPDNQFVGTTVEDDVAFGLENQGIPREEMVNRVIEALKHVKMEQFLNQEPHHLSGGQKQRVAIASVLALRPSIILLDEATSMLDPKGRAEVIETVKTLKERYQLTVISITHDLEEAVKADRVIVMNGGKVFSEGVPKEIFGLDEQLVQLGLDIPFAVKLRKALQEKGISVSSQLMNEEELVNELWTLHCSK